MCWPGRTVMFRFIHAADIHLDSPQQGLQRYEGAPLAQVRGATRAAFDNLIEHAIAEKVAFVVIAGDLFDGDWKDYNTGLHFISRMVRLREAGIAVFIVSGNHDAETRITKSLRLPDNVTLFSTQHPETAILKEFDVAIHGQGYSERVVSAKLAAAYPKGKSPLFNIGLLHTSLTGRPGHEPYAPCGTDDLLGRHYQYWALGHVHQREQIPAEIPILFPGNLQGRHIRESGPKGCSLVTVKDGEVAELRHLELAVMRWQVLSVSINGADNVDAVLDEVSAALGRCLLDLPTLPLAVRLILTGKTSTHAKLMSASDDLNQQIRALALQVAGGRLWIEKVQLETQRAVSLEEALLQDSSIGDLLQYLQSLRADEGGLRILGAELDGLKRRLPLELSRGGDAFDPGDPRFLEKILEEVQELLLENLLTAAGPE